MNLEQKIEALLFFKGEEMSVKDIAAALKADVTDVEAALATLATTLETRGLRLVRAGTSAMLGTPAEMSTLFEELRKEELSKELSKASLETLSIVLYKPGTTKTEINFIRGVNSSFILRALEVRGFVERAGSDKDGRVASYKPTVELLSYLGAANESELPRFEEIKKSLEDKLREPSPEIANA